MPESTLALRQDANGTIEQRQETQSKGKFWLYAPGRRELKV